MELFFTGTYGVYLTKHKQINFWHYAVQTCSAITFPMIDTYCHLTNVRANGLRKTGKTAYEKHGNKTDYVCNYVTVFKNTLLKQKIYICIHYGQVEK
jgi:hypothetical protein